MADFPELPCGAIVYRAIPHENHLTNNGRIKWQSLKPRHSDLRGISCALVPNDAVKNLQNPVPGIMSIHVGRVRDVMVNSIRLDVIQDAEDHCYLDGIPNNNHATDPQSKNRMEDDMQALCNALIKSAVRLHARTDPENPLQD